MTIAQVKALAKEVLPNQQTPGRFILNPGVTLVDKVSGWFTHVTEIDESGPYPNTILFMNAGWYPVERFEAKQ